MSVFASVNGKQSKRFNIGFFKLTISNFTIKISIIEYINKIIKDAKKGKLFLLVDNKDRENEGDLVVPASKCNYKKLILWQRMEEV